MSKHVQVHKELTELLHAVMPFSITLGFEVIEGTPEKIVARAKWEPERCTMNGVMHGGYILAIADTAANMCTGLNLSEGARTLTMESKTNFFRKVSEGYLELVSTPVHIGRSTIVIQTDIFNEQGKLVSRTTQTQSVTK